MKELNEKAWDLYPKDYKKLSKGQREDVKQKLKQEHPELKEIWSEYFSLKGKLERDALNYRIQGLAGSQLKMAGIIFRRYIISNNLSDKMYITSLIHDEALAEATLEYAEQCKEQIEYAMITGGNKFCKKIKMAAEGIITPYWHH